MTTTAKYTTEMSVEEILSSPAFIEKFEKTASEMPFLQELLSSLAGERPFTTNIKAVRTAAEKILRKLSTKPHYSEEEIGDFLRGNIIAQDDADAQALLGHLRDVAEIIALDDFSNNPTPWGYNGININILSPEGNKVEVQIHTPETIAVQNALHSLYEEWRNELEVPLYVFEESKRLADEARRQVRGEQA